MLDSVATLGRRDNSDILAPVHESPERRGADSPGNPRRAAAFSGRRFRARTASRR